MLGTLKRTIEVPHPVQAPREPWKDLQSAHAKLKRLDHSLDVIESKIAKINQDLTAAQDAREDMLASRDELTALIDSYSPKSDQSKYVNTLENIIKSIQAKLSAGMPAAGSDSQSQLYDTVFKGITTPPRSEKGDGEHDETQSISSEPMHESHPLVSGPDAELDAAQAAPASPDPSSLVVDKDGFGFNPVPRKASSLSAHYARPARSCSQGASLFSPTLPCALAPGSACGKA